MTAALKLFNSRSNKNGGPSLTGEATVKTVIDWYRTNSSRVVTSQPAETERQKIWQLFVKRYGGWRVQDCLPLHLLNFINARLTLRSAASRQRWCVTIQRPFNLAEKLGLIPKNTFRGVTFPRGVPGRDWTDAEMQTLLRGSSARFRRFLIWIRFSGQRPGEVRHLKWSDVNFEDRSIVLHEHKTKYATGKRAGSH